MAHFLIPLLRGMVAACLAYHLSLLPRRGYPTLVSQRVIRPHHKLQLSLRTSVERWHWRMKILGRPHMKTRMTRFALHWAEELEQVCRNRRGTTLRDIGNGDGPGLWWYLCESCLDSTPIKPNRLVMTCACFSYLLRTFPTYLLATGLYTLSPTTVHTFGRCICENESPHQSCFEISTDLQGR